VQAWRAALTAHGPVAIILTRQNVPGLTHGGELSRGAYVLSDPDGEPDAIVMASGSELSLAVEARERLAAEGVGVRVVNMPSMELFAEQDDTYRESVLPSGVEVRVAVEAGHPMAWYRWVGLRGAVVGLNRFGESGPYDAVYESLGITAGEVVKAVKNRLGI
jgi:transketolase